MIVILVYSIAIMQPETYQDKPFPTSSYAAGWILFAFGVLQFPIWALVAIFRNSHQQSVFQAIKSAFQPSELWKPEHSKISREWIKFKEIKGREQKNISDETLFKKFKILFLGRTTHDIKLKLLLILYCECNIK